MLDFVNPSPEFWCHPSRQAWYILPYTILFNKLYKNNLGFISKGEGSDEPHCPGQAKKDILEEPVLVSQ